MIEILQKKLAECELRIKRALGELAELQKDRDAIARVITCIGTAQPEATLLTCEKCGAPGFPTQRALTHHVKKCDGIKRTAAERKVLATKKWRDAHRPSKKQKAEAEAKKVANNVELASYKGSNGHSDMTGVGVQCLDCGAKYPNAKELGTHRLQTHFG